MSELSARLLRLPEERRRRLLQHMRGTAAPDRRMTDGPAHDIEPGTLSRGFRAQALATPDAPAVTDGECAFGYAELYDRAAALAAALCAHGVGPGDLVPVLMRRSARSTAALLGILLAGAAYVPLDPETPPGRRARVLRACASRVAVADELYAADLAGSGLETVLDRQPPAGTRNGALAAHAAERARPADPAYVLFTSGTTGSPKGVVVEHRSAHHFARAIAADYQITPDDRVLQFASYGFDISVFELFAALLAGAQLVVAPDEERRAPDRLVQRLIEHAVTVAELPPALLPLLDPAGLDRLRLVSLGGEAFSGRIADRWAAPGRRIVNGYGPTECTVAVTLYDCPPGAVGNAPIGRPIANHRVFVLDDQLRQVPPGAEGELCIAGPQVARGYLNDPGLTATGFTPNPYSTGAHDQRLYRTGDRARWRQDANLEFLGRLDRQMKVRGFRVEPAEVEQRLATHPSVHQAVVVPVSVPGRSPMLVGYATGPAQAGRHPQASTELREYLAEWLPAYMVPHAVIVVDSFPATVNGKVDTAALPQPELWAALDEPGDALADEPGDALARQIAREILAPLLAVPSLPEDAEFFAAGGDSLQAIHCVAQVFSRFGVRVDMMDFLTRPTAAELAGLVRAERAKASRAQAELAGQLDAIERAQADDGPVRP